MTRTRSVEALLIEKMGLDPDTVGGSLIVRGLQARMAALGLKDRREYERLAWSSAEETQELIEEIVVPESWFFRDDRPFAFLKEHARSGWLNAPDRPPLRLLSLPCAAGEEPYSIAIALLDLGLPAERFHVDAVDISERSLARARQGVYSRNAFRSRDTAFQSHYFREGPAGFELDAAVRATVRFVRGNLAEPGLLAGERPYDVIFCRNLLIYLTDAARAQASATLVRLLAVRGLLFLGHAERLELEGVRLVPVGDKGSFAYWREASPPSLGLPAPQAPRAAALPWPVRAHAGGRPRDRQRPAPAPMPAGTPGAASANRIRPEPPPAPPSRPGPGDAATGAELDRAAELAGQGKYDEAVSLCERSLRESGPSARAFFLLGMIRQAAGDRDQAEASFQKTVYLDAQHDEALLALALIAERRGDDASATGYRRRAERALARKEAR